jgi:hypothetical protein
MVEYARLCICSGLSITMTPISFRNKSRMKSALSDQRSASCACESCSSSDNLTDPVWVGVNEMPPKLPMAADCVKRETVVVI